MIIRFFNNLKSDIKPFKTAIFTVIIAVIAAFIVSVISSAGNFIIQSEMDAMGMDGISVSVYNKDGENITDINLYNHIKQLDDIQSISPIICNAATAVFSNGISVEVMGWGIDSGAEDIFSLDISGGRMINKSDIIGKSFVCLVDKSLAESIYKRSNINGKTINLIIGNKTVPLRIIGTVEKESNILNTLTGDIIPNFVYLPYTTMSNLISNNNYNQIVFTSNNTNLSASEFKERLVELSRNYRNKTIKMTNLSSQKEQISKIAEIAFMSLFVVSCVSVVVCSMSVGASVNTAVISKQKDIGIKISMGASRTDIVKEFLFLSSTACFIGIVSAVLIMIILIYIIRLFIPYTFTIEPNLILFSIFATMTLTLIFSFMPSYTASKMSPIKALNRE